MILFICPRQAQAGLGHAVVLAVAAGLPAGQARERPFEEQAGLRGVSAYPNTTLSMGSKFISPNTDIGQENRDDICADLVLHDSCAIMMELGGYRCSSLEDAGIDCMMADACSYCDKSEEATTIIPSSELESTKEFLLMPTMSGETVANGGDAAGLEQTFLFQVLLILLICVGATGALIVCANTSQRRNTETQAKAVVAKAVVKLDAEAAKSQRPPSQPQSTERAPDNQRSQIHSATRLTKSSGNEDIDGSIPASDSASELSELPSAAATNRASPSRSVQCADSDGIITAQRRNEKEAANKAADSSSAEAIITAFHRAMSASRQELPNNSQDAVSCDDTKTVSRRQIRSGGGSPCDDRHRMSVAQLKAQQLLTLSKASRAKRPATTSSAAAAKLLGP